MIVLFTDFGASDLYLGQVKATLRRAAPRIPVVDALNDAPDFTIEPAAHLLAALAPRYPHGSVFLAVIDPGVGGPRGAIVVEVDGRRFVGPDNGLLSILWQRTKRARCWRIVWRPALLASTFHGRDLFAPVAAALARGRMPAAWLAASRAPRELLDTADLAQVIYEEFSNLLRLRIVGRDDDRGCGIDSQMSGNRLHALRHWNQRGRRRRRWRFGLAVIAGR